MTLFILLPVHNRRDTTRRFMESLIRQKYRTYHLLLLDDGSTDGTDQMVRSYLDVDKLTVIRGNGSWWWGGALHQGYLWLKRQELNADDPVLIINDDTEMGETYLGTGVELLRQNLRTLLVSRCTDRTTGEIVDPGTYHLEYATRAFETVEGATTSNCCSTRGLFLRASDLLAIGGFHPRLLPHYLSDIEFTCRAQKKGYRFLRDERLALSLDHGATGFHDHHFPASSRREFLKNYFSNGYSGNPIHWSNFVLLALPWRYKGRHLFNIWKSALRIITHKMIRVTPKTPVNP